MIKYLFKALFYRYGDFSYKTCCLVIFSLFLTVTFYAQANSVSLVNYFENITQKQGLSQSTVKDIVQDNNGFLWLATYDGLNRYDGYQFKIYRSISLSPNDLSSNFLTSLAIADELLWIGTLDAGLSSYDSKTDQFRNYKLSSNENLVQKRILVNTLFTTIQGDLLIGTKNSGAFIKRTDEFTFLPIALEQFEERSDSSWSADQFAQTDDGAIWIATRKHGLLKLDSHNLVASQFKVNGKEEYSNVPIKSIVSFENTLFIGIDDQGIIKITKSELIDPQPGYFISKLINTNKIPSKIAALKFDEAQNTLIIGTEGSGVINLNLATLVTDFYTKSVEQQKGIVDNFVHSLLIDSSNVLWIGTDNGLSKYSKANNRFGHWKIEEAKNKKNKNRNMIWSISSWEDYLLIGSETGLAVLNKELDKPLNNPWLEELTKNFENLRINNISKFHNNTFWFATSQGLISAELSVFNNSKDFNINFKTKFPNQWINSQLIDSKGQIWVGVEDDGLYLLNGQAKIKEHYLHSTTNPLSLSSNQVLKIFEDKQQNIWVLTKDGLNLKDNESNQFNHYQFNSSDQNSISNNYLTTAFQSKGGELWFGTSNGLNQYDWLTDSFQRYHVDDGLPNNQITAITDDENGNLWIATTKGLSKFDVIKKLFTNYFVDDGLQSNEFNSNAIYEIDKKLVLGGNNGFNLFDPNDIYTDKTHPRVVLTDLLLFNKKIGPKRIEKAQLFEGTIDSTHELEFNYSDSMITFEFSALHYTDSKRNQYAYYMQGYDKEWIYTDASKRFATYTSLPSGDYIFKIKGANKDGVWSKRPTEIRIQKLPPWWLTQWAYALYISAVFGIFYLYNGTQKLKLIKEQENTHALLELDRIKDEFLAKTSHELRTPLNGIIGLSDSLISGVTGRLPEKTRQNLKIISSSGKRLAKLVNDILDFSQLKHQGVRLHKKNVDLASLIEVLISLCEPLLEGKQIKIVAELPESLPAIYGDEARIEQIMINLMGNAINHTQQGQITISARVTNTNDDSQMMTVMVSDTGSGIRIDQSEKIFDSFWQFEDSQKNIQRGVGLGLAITKHLVELHGGTISAENTTEGASFSFTLPIEVGTETTPLNENNFSTSNRQIPLQKMEIFEQKQHFVGEQQRILVADDEPVNCQVVANFLTEKNYDITIVGDGKQVMQAIESDRPFDLVVLDVVMPKLSGYEVCKLIRKDKNCFELPILMLSAKTEANDIVVGLKSGANDYVSKPVEKAEFLARVETLLNLKKIHILRRQRDDATVEASENLKLALHGQKYDTLTGLPNRNIMKFKLRQAILQADHNNQSLALLFVGLNKFGQVNERFGHEKGDLVLKEIASRLRNSLRDSDTIVRFGSDTFVIGVYKIDRNKSTDSIRNVIRNILYQTNRIINEPFQVDQETVSLSATCGVSIYPQSSVTVEELFRHADIALHHAKSINRGGCEFYCDEISNQNSIQFEIESSLREALANNEFSLVYQPQVCIKSQQVIGAEALIRWHSPTYGLVSPATFIPVAEDIGIIIEIGKWVIGQACQDINRWREQGINFGKVAVNLSVHQFKDKKLMQHIESCISENNLLCADLELEITEGILVENVEATKQLLNQFKDKGHQLSIDDFGTGYSSLSYLKQFPINTLKIDQSFIKDLLKDDRSKAIVKSIIDLAKGLGLETIAEGVETVEQWHYLKELNCAQVQGYLINKPVTFKEFDVNLFSKKKLHHYAN